VQQAWPYLPGFRFAPPERVFELTLGPSHAGNVSGITTVPGGEAWYLRAARAVLVSDATVVNRSVGIAYGDGNLEFFRAQHQSVQAASLTITWNWAIGYSYGIGTAGSMSSASLPGLLLLPGYTLTTVIAAGAAGDAVSGVRYMIEKIAYRGRVEELYSYALAELDVAARIPTLAGEV
jgi:hypothetical protein